MEHFGLQFPKHLLSFSLPQEGPHIRITLFPASMPYNLVIFQGIQVSNLYLKCTVSNIHEVLFDCFLT